jgi:hypothetical protein
MVDNSETMGSGEECPRRYCSERCASSGRPRLRSRRGLQNCQLYFLPWKICIVDEFGTESVGIACGARRWEHVEHLEPEVGPAIGGLVFGWGLDIGMIGLVWWCYLTVFVVLELMWSWMLKDKGNTSTKNVSQEAVELLAAPGCAL